MNNSIKQHLDSMNKIEKLNRKRHMHLNIITYTCTKCHNPERLNITGPMSERKRTLIEKCFDKKICLKCYCNSQIPKTAAVIQNFLTGKYQSIK